MAMLRIYFRKYPALMMVFIALILAVKAMIPTGYMLVQGENGLMMVICPGTDISVAGAQSADMPVTDAGQHLNHMKSNAGHIQHGPGSDAQEKMNGHPCAFTSLSHAALGGADLPLLALALLFILALGFVAIPAPNLPKSGFLRPQLRGPPAAI